MTALPPKPVPHERKLSPLRRIKEVRRCSISVLYDKSYVMQMGDVWTPRRMFYFVNQPELVDRVLKTEAERFPKSTVMSSMLGLLLGNGVFVSNGETWRKQRRMMDPAFEQARIQDVFPLMRNAADAMVERLSRNPDGTAVALDEEMTHVTADIIFRTIFSRPLTREESTRIFNAFSRFQELAYAQGVWSMAGVPRWLSAGRLVAARHARTIRGLLERGVDERMAMLATGGSVEHHDILSSLMEAVDPVTGDRFTRKELVDQIAVLFLAGHETSASALGWALYLIATHPEIQERLHQESDGVFGGRAAEFGDMRRLRLARDVFRESLRLYPPVSFISRDTVQTEKMRSKTLAKGSVVMVSPWLIHRHRRLWDRPDDFDPDRFSTPAGKESSRHAYLPFSAGPRVCLGASFAMQEATLIVAQLMRDFHFDKVPDHTPVPTARLTLRSENGIRLMVRTRSSAPRAAVPESRDQAEEPATPAGCPFH